jgi:hypothetical protein
LRTLEEAELTVAQDTASVARGRVHTPSVGASDEELANGRLGVVVTG